MKLLADGTGSSARGCLEEARAQRCEPTDRNRIEGLAGESAQDDEARQVQGIG